MYFESLLTTTSARFLVLLKTLCGVRPAKPFTAPGSSLTRPGVCIRPTRRDQDYGVAHRSFFLLDSQPFWRIIVAPARGNRYLFEERRPTLHTAFQMRSYCGHAQRCKHVLFTVARRWLPSKHSTFDLWGDATNWYIHLRFRLVITPRSFALLILFTVNRPCLETVRLSMLRNNKRLLPAFSGRPDLPVPSRTTPMSLLTPVPVGTSNSRELAQNVSPFWGRDYIICGGQEPEWP